MSATRVFVARLAGCAVFDPAGDRVGKARDVLVVYRKNDPPRVVGLIVEIPGKRRVFVSIGRVTSIGGGQIITTGLINLRRFEQRGGEVRVIAEMLGRKVVFNDGSGEATIEDVAIEEREPGEWEVDQLFVRRPKGASPFSKGQSAYVTWREVREAISTGEAQSAEQLIATYSELKPADLANTLLDLPMQRRQEVAEELSDDRLADVLEEMLESDQVGRVIRLHLVENVGGALVVHAADDVDLVLLGHFLERVGEPVVGQLFGDLLAAVLGQVEKGAREVGGKEVGVGGDELLG